MDSVFENVYESYTWMIVTLYVEYMLLPYVSPLLISFSDFLFCFALFS
jgi:hypothetical protein